MLLKQFLIKTQKNPNLNPNIQDSQGTKTVQVQTSKAREKEDNFFHPSVKCQNVILILPVLRKSKEDYQAIKPSGGSFVVGVISIIGGTLYSDLCKTFISQMW